MSDESDSYTSVLLPAAEIALFTKDPDSRQAFEALGADWRFARVVLTVHEGDVDAAAAMYKSAASPALVIVQTDDIDNGFSEKLESLAGSCSEGTSAIVVGPVNDVNLYRRLVGMGVSDYLVKPLKTAQLASDIAATLIEQIGASGSRLIVLMGAKGGVGTTSLAEGLAWGVSEKLGQKTFLLDAAGGWSSLSVGLNFEPSATLAEAARAAADGKADNLTRMIYKAGERLFVLSSGGDVMLDDSVDAGSYEALLDYLMAIYPVVILDLSGATAELKRTALTKAHEILLVTTPTLPSVRAARTLIQEIKELRGNNDGNLDVLVNMQGFAPKHEVSKNQIEEGLERKPAAVIPFDPALFVKAESEGRKLTEAKPGAAIMDQILPLVTGILSLPGADAGGEAGSAAKKGGLSGILTKLKTK